MPVSLEGDADFPATRNFLNRLLNGSIFDSLDRFGELGVDALSSATPKDSGLASRSWRYEVSRERGSYVITWHNDNIENGLSVALLIQYGHGTGTGGYVAGIDYINPAINPVFIEAIDQVWEEVSR